MSVSVTSFARTLTIGTVAPTIPSMTSLATRLAGVVAAPMASFTSIIGRAAPMAPITPFAAVFWMATTMAPALGTVRFATTDEDPIPTLGLAVTFVSNAPILILGAAITFISEAPISILWDCRGGGSSRNFHLGCSHLGYFHLGGSHLDSRRGGYFHLGRFHLDSR
eukprot:CAMPEP_0201963696 /NCGR_PEP_ID=MMETSP0904-20121228/9522_1 /ASSEMBLY_ACC=CAM_ASM_000553 /TAXON_ID=420261 /ORGANISM="Thalassiosira antarctica, Strain CCMP982" /LENGTH=165 /DNA_ID=CAMNT_0048510387 /DNA_START=315 /DNA_END=808 /DNA_ORIENTATION=+